MHNEKNYQEELLIIIDRLIGPNGCPWDHDQKLQDLRHMIIEEAYELVDAISEGKNEKIADEAGDLLITVFFLTKVADKDGYFSWKIPFQKACEKLIRRHPHIFADGEKLTTAKEVKDQWEEIKKTEEVHQDRKSLLDGIPASLPALSMMQKLIHKAKKSEKLHKALENSLKNRRDDKEEEVGRKLANLIEEAEKNNIHTEESLRKFFATLQQELKKSE
jgi:tetrapyrrole methylase family protein / MazG family protein